MIEEVVPVVEIAAAPQVRLLDARSRDLDITGLRDWARTLGAQSRAAHCSRSYCYPLALVAWHAAPVGVDIERLESSDPGFARSICTPAELADLGDGATVNLTAISLWCSKEALSKALGDARDYDPRRLEAPSCWPAGRSGPWCAASLWAVSGYVAWLCWHQPPSSVERERT